MDSDQQMVFSSDCVINLDDLPPPQDYQDLLLTLSTQLKSSSLSPQTTKRLTSSDLTDIIKQPHYQKTLQPLLTSLHKYPLYSNKILGFLFELCQIYMFDPDIPERLVKLFIQSYTKNMNEVTHRMLLVFLQRVSSKIVYIDKSKWQVVIQFLRLGVGRECGEGEENRVVMVVDVLLRHRELRRLLGEVGREMKAKTDEERVFVIKCAAYEGKDISPLINTLTNQQYINLMKQLLHNLN